MRQAERVDDHPIRALLWMGASALALSAMGIFVKKLAGALPGMELVFFRSVINLLLIVGLMLYTGEKFLPRRRGGPAGLKILIVRGIAGFGAVTSLFYSIAHLPLPIAMILYWSAPIFVIFFSRLFLGERQGRQSLLWSGVAFAGLLLVLRPDLASGPAVSLPLAWVLVGVFGAASGGVAYVAVRAATARVGVNVIIFYFVGVSTLLSVPLALLDFRMPTVAQGWEILALAACGSAGQLMMTQGYRYAPAGLASMMTLLNTAFSALFGWLIFSETLSGLQWTGMLVLALSIAALTAGAGRRS